MIRLLILLCFIGKIYHYYYSFLSDPYIRVICYNFELLI